MHAQELFSYEYSLKCNCNLNVYVTTPEFNGTLNIIKTILRKKIPISGDQFLGRNTESYFELVSFNNICFNIRSFLK